MLKRQASFLKSVLFLADLGLICACWLLAYYLRFSGFIIPLEKDVHPLWPYLILLVPIIVVWAVVFRTFNLYRPRRMSSHLAEVFDIAKANALAVLILVAITFFAKEFEYSRLVLLYFWALNLLVLAFSRMGFREGLRFMRRRGLNLRHSIVVGTGPLAQIVARRLSEHPEFGVRIKGLVSRDDAHVGRQVHGLPVVGAFGDLRRVARSGIDIVFICLGSDEESELEKILSALGNTLVDIKVVPYIYGFRGLRMEAEIFEGLPIITLQGSPLVGWSIVFKRVIDLVGAVSALVLTSPILLMIASAIRLSSPGPILYRQVRMGLDGRVFEMLKFRSMMVDAEADTGPMWAKPEDHRRTAVGAFLRRTSLDELPQFWNVLKGDMSIVGPRPERPEFITRFRETLPQYMLRHKMKAGITGWAQVNGWRGNTSLEKRIEHDLYYIEHWSIWFDIKIMLLTVWKGFVHRHAY
jgi:Undecaprenyl-phosphate glucose phosphotransferase